MERGKARRPLTTDEIERFKARMLERRDELMAEVRRDLLERLGEKYQDLIETVRDEEDLAQADLQEETVFEVLRARKEELEAISQALWRIEHGEYGRCLRCGDWICIERLEVRPWAAYCKECKEALEGPVKSKTI